MAFQRGDVVLVPFPFSNLTTTKVRPAVVLSSALYHRTQPDVILGAVTSNTSTATTPSDYVLNDWQQAGLRYPSAFKAVIFTLEPVLILHRIGALSPSDLREVSRRTRSALEL